MFGGLDEISLFQTLIGVTGIDGHVLEDAGITITINHASRATIAYEFGLIEFIDITHGRFPEMASVKVQVPVQIEILMAAEANEALGLSFQVPLHLGEGLGWINHREAAAALHFFDFFEHADEFLGGIIDEIGIAKAQVAGLEVGKGIAECAAVKTKFLEEGGQFFVIIDEFAGGHAGGCLNPEVSKAGIGFLDFTADIGQPSVFFMAHDVMGVDGHDDAAEAIVCERSHVLIRPERAVGTDHGVDSAFSRVSHHRSEIFVDEGFTPDEQDVADMVFQGDVDHIPGFLEGDAVPSFWIELIDCKATEVTFCVANVGDGELEVAWASIRENTGCEFEEPLFGALHRGLGNAGGGTSGQRSGQHV